MSENRNKDEAPWGEAFGLPVAFLRRMDETMGEPVFVESSRGDRVRITMSLQLSRLQLQQMREATPVVQPRRDFHQSLVEALRETLLQRFR
jgi:hypothetical protein